MRLLTLRKLLALFVIHSTFDISVVVDVVAHIVESCFCTSQTQDETKYQFIKRKNILCLGNEHGISFSSIPAAIFELTGFL